jgi:protein-L-isoaspartate O-methyltransferase
MHFTRLAGIIYPDPLLAERLRDLPFPQATHLAPRNIEAALRIAPDLVAAHFSRTDEEQRALLADQLAKSWAYDGTVLDALVRAPRWPFVRATSRIIANWAGVHVLRGANAVESAWLVAFIATQMRVRSGMRILVLGSGAGYGLSLLGAIVGPTGQVTGVEIDAGIRHGAWARLSEVSLYPNFSVVQGDALTWHSDERFDAIWATLSVPRVPEAWTNLLAPAGRLLAFLPVQGPAGQAVCPAVDLVTIEHANGQPAVLPVMDGLVNAAFATGLASDPEPFREFAELEDRIAVGVRGLLGA